MIHPGKNIVVVGASAGGVDALQRLVGGLPPNFPGSVFIVLHIWPDGKSVLPAILQRAGPLPAVHPQDGEVFQPGKIYVAPNDLHMFLEEDHIQLLRGPRENRCRPAINPLFRSAAAAYGSRVVGIVLTGTMDDGAAGLWAIKQCGGTTIVQDPSDASFSEMPQNALKDVQVDYCLPLAEIPPLLMKLAREPAELNSFKAPPKVTRFNDEGAKMKSNNIPMDEVGKRSVFSCPECNGALWELQEGNLLQFRCHVGHGYSGTSLEAGQNFSIEQSLWSALRALKESAELDKRLAERSAENGLQSAAKLYKDNALEKTEQAKQLLDFLATFTEQST